MTLDEIIAHAGGVMRLAEAAGVNHSTISSGWRRQARVPVDRARRVSAALSIPLYEIRPDIWPPPGEAA